MQQGIHPKYHDKAKVECACGAAFETGSTKKDIQVDVCSKCHPFFTGEMKYVDTMGRVEKFEAKRKKAQKQTKKKKEKKEKEKEKKRPQSLKDMLKEKKNEIKTQKSSKKSS